jgi:hypothetical protein
MEGKFAAQRTIAIILASSDWFHREPYVSERYRPGQSYLDDSIARDLRRSEGSCLENAVREILGAPGIGSRLSRFCNVGRGIAPPGLRSLREIVVGSCVRK